MRPPPDSGPSVYLLRCADGSFYAGAAKDLAARVEAHQTGRGARYTRGRRPVTLVWHQACADWPGALRCECRLKRLTRRGKETLVRSGRPLPAG